MTIGTARVIRGNALALPLEDESVDLICTSPHYMGRPDGFRDKSLMGIPWRYALRAIDDLGLILVWHVVQWVRRERQS
jgi:hypothetical protein